MAGSNAQKLKILNVMEILRTQTDPSHGLTMPQIIEALDERGIKAERKSLYKDIETLRSFGLDIRTLQRQPVQYALVERDFELSQLMLLIDAVQSCRFLSEGASRALIKSIRDMASVPERRALNKYVHVQDRPGRQSQSDFVIVDKLHEAMRRRKKISFSYFRWDASKQKVARKRGDAHVVTPINLTYSDGNYYLVAFSEADNEIRNYRIDRMDKIETLEEPATRNDIISSYDPAEVAKCTFGMYEGKRVTATMRVNEKVMNVIIDRFGKDVKAKPIEYGKYARVSVSVKQSPVFYGWLAQLGPDIEIEQPTYLRDDYLAWLKSITDVYKKKK